MSSSMTHARTYRTGEDDRVVLNLIAREHSLKRTEVPAAEPPVSDNIPNLTPADILVAAREFGEVFDTDGRVLNLRPSETFPCGRSTFWDLYCDN